MATCSWCTHLIPGPDDSHGMCPACADKARADMQSLLEARADLLAARQVNTVALQVLGAEIESAWSRSIAHTRQPAEKIPTAGVAA